MVETAHQRIIPGAVYKWRENLRRIYQQCGIERSPASTYYSNMDAIKRLFERQKPALAMVLVQFIFTFGTLAAKALFSTGTTPMVFITYRQAVAMLVMVPAALLIRGPRKMALGLRAFTLVFFASLIGCTLNQYLYYQGLKMTSSSMGSAMNNLIPAVTFLIATSFGLEKMKLRSIRSMAKILGTIICVGGAVFMAFYKGPKLFNMNLNFHTLSAILRSVNDKWMIGFIFLTGATCCGSLWLILQVPICKNYLDPLALATWMCILSTFQSFILTYSLESDWQAWKITSTFELMSIIYTGIFASGITFYIQSWVISVKGPVFSALFNPVQIVIATILGFIMLHEELYVGGLIGAIAVVSGLYIVLWGKAKDFEPKGELQTENGFPKNTVSVDPQLNNREEEMRKPLLNDVLEDIESQVKS